MNSINLNKSIIAKDENRIESKHDIGNNDIPAISKKDDSRSNRMLQPIKVNANIGTLVDLNVVSYQLYNSFDCSFFLSEGLEPKRISIGITSAGNSEGKTTTASNLAAALALGAGKKIIIVDFNFLKPRIHEVFGISRGPGLSEALNGENICITPTQINNLFVLPIGNIKISTPKSLSTFWAVLESLFNEFEFVIIDLPPVGMRAFPALIANQLSGLLMVIRASVTKRRDVNRTFRRIRQEKVLGFVMNGINDDDY